MNKMWIGASLGALATMLVSLPAVGADIPKANHYVCYPVKEVAFKAREATFIDQFGKWTVTVVRPTQLCTPADKLIGKDKYPTIDAKLHMVCYEVKFNGKAPPLVQTIDQFGTLKFKAGPATSVCLPASKTVLKQ